MPSILTLEGPKLLGFGTPQLGLLRMNGAIGDALSCGGCQRPSGMGDAASDDLNRFNQYLLAYMAQVRATSTAAKYLGLLGTAIGAIAGSLAGKRFSKRKHAKLIGAAGGALGLGIVTYYASQSLMMPDFVAPPTAAQQLLTKDLTF